MALSPVSMWVQFSLGGEFLRAHIRIPEPIDRVQSPYLLWKGTWRLEKVLSSCQHTLAAFILVTDNFGHPTIFFFSSSIHQSPCFHYSIVPLQPRIGIYVAAQTWSPVNAKGTFRLTSFLIPCEAQHCAESWTRKRVVKLNPDTCWVQRFPSGLLFRDGVPNWHGS
jgi:hypothetical protein